MTQDLAEPTRPNALGMGPIDQLSDSRLNPPPLLNQPKRPRFGFYDFAGAQPT